MRLALSLLLMLVAASRLPAEEWPQWRGARQNGTWNAPPLREDWPAEGLTVRWRGPLGGGYAGIVAVQGRVITMDRQEEPAEVERVVCFHADTGELLWQHSYPVSYGDLDYGNGPRAAPTLHQGRVYTLGAMGHACCLDAETGQPLWEHELLGGDAEKLPEWGLAASPVIWRDLVILHPGIAPDGCYVAFDRVTGDERWRCGDDPAGYCTPLLVEHAGQELLICWSPKHVLGIAPADGEILWSVPYEVTYGVSIATPIFVDGLVVVSGYWEGTKAIRLGADPRAVQLAWEDDRELRALMSQPLYRDGLGFLLDKHHGLIGFELATGKRLWDDGHRLTERGRNPQASLIWTGHADQALALNAEGHLVLARLNSQGYDERARAPIIGPTWAHPAFAGATVFARDDKEIVAVELPVSP